VCNLYSVTTNQEAIRRLFRVINCYVGNLAPMPAPAEEALKLQRPLGHGSLRIVARGVKEDSPVHWDTGTRGSLGPIRGACRPGL
jgi:hypothetical protein